MKNRVFAGLPLNRVFAGFVNIGDLPEDPGGLLVNFVKYLSLLMTGPEGAQYHGLRVC